MNDSDDYMLKFTHIVNYSVRISIIYCSPVFLSKDVSSFRKINMLEWRWIIHQNTARLLTLRVD